MRKAIVFFSVVLLLWIAACSYYYICKVRDNCRKETVNLQSDIGVQPEDIAVDSLVTGQSAPALTVPAPLIVHFATGKSTCVLTSSDINHIEQFKQFVSESPESILQVTGHTDNTGSDEVNLKISKQRANFMKQKLIDAGIPQNSIETISKASTEPIADNSTPAGQASNRRTEIEIK